MYIHVYMQIYKHVHHSISLSRGRSARSHRALANNIYIYTYIYIYTHTYVYTCIYADTQTCTSFYFSRAAVPRALTGR